MPEEELKPIEQWVRFFKFGLIKDFAKEIRKDQPKEPAFSKAVLPPERGPAGSKFGDRQVAELYLKPSTARARRRLVQTIVQLRHARELHALAGGHYLLRLSDGC